MTISSWINYLDIRKKYDQTDPEENLKAKAIKFVFLWMKYNEYYTQHGPRKPDRINAIQLKENPAVQQKYNEVKNIFISSFSRIPMNDITDIPRFYLINGDGTKTYYGNTNNNTLEDFLIVIYKIRCNFFHGDKEPNETNLQLIAWAYDSLSTLLTGLQEIW